MKITANIDHTDITRNLIFHGETNADEEVVQEIKELKEFLTDVFEEILHLKKMTEMRNENSAREIYKSIAELQKNLILYVIDIDKDFHDDNLYQGIKEFMGSNNYELED